MRSRIAFCSIAWLLLVSAAPAQHGGLMARKLYEVVIETGMPHLEENLRYAETRQERCLSEADLSRVFPILEHPSLVGCELRKETTQGDTIRFELACEGSHGTTGNASWRISEHALHGTLRVKLGGKNMTLFQRVTAKPVGQCRTPV